MTDAHTPGSRAGAPPNGLVGVGVITLDGEHRVLLGLGHDGRWELPGGKADPGESFERAGVRELTEETGLSAGPDQARVLAVLIDERGDMPRVTAAALVNGATGAARVTEPDKIVRWEWFAPDALPRPLFAPSAAVLRAWRPDLALPPDGSHHYRLA
ncbi:NUDIX domain-containing protein [Streptomyces sp. ODS28]|uniref:nucleotide triphosphate diphosphatase NUDT15 n=1 Tax=Streptomyces sp. ODS28 TaxID=3136688 RepID=UPI0031E7823C